MKGFLSRLAAKMMTSQLGNLRPKIGSTFEPASKETSSTFIENRWTIPSEDLIIDNPVIEDGKQIYNSYIPGTQNKRKWASTNSNEILDELGEAKHVDISAFERKDNLFTYNAGQQDQFAETSITAKVTPPKYQIEDDDISQPNSQDSGDQKNKPNPDNLVRSGSDLEMNKEALAISAGNISEIEAVSPGIKNSEIEYHYGEIDPKRPMAPIIITDITDTIPEIIAERSDTSKKKSVPLEKGIDAQQNDAMIAKSSTHIRTIQSEKALHFEKPLNFGMKRTRSVQDFIKSDSVPTEHEIHVTIGRIEVKAVQQEPRPQKREPLPKVMSLNEYLSQRSKAGVR